MIHSLIIVWYLNYKELSAYPELPSLRALLENWSVCIVLQKSTWACSRQGLHGPSKEQFFCSFEGLEISAKHSLQGEIYSFIRTTDVVEGWTEERNCWMLPAVLPTSTAGRDLFKHSYQSRANISYTSPYTLKAIKKITNLRFLYWSLKTEERTVGSWPFQLITTIYQLKTKVAHCWRALSFCQTGNF